MFISWVHCLIIFVCLSLDSFWPGSLLYMVTVLPAIWVAELAILDQKLAGDPQKCEANAFDSTFSIPGGVVRINDACFAGVLVPSA